MSGPVCAWAANRGRLADEYSSPDADAGRLRQPLAEGRPRKQHAEELERVLIAYRDSQPFTVITEPDPEPGFVRARIDGAPKPVPVDVSLVLGDAMHALRTALDHFACAAVGTPANDTAFPIPDG
jgi:hypothetical protein